MEENSVCYIIENRGRGRKARGDWGWMRGRRKIIG